MSGENKSWARSAVLAGIVLSVGFGGFVALAAPAPTHEQVTFQGTPRSFADIAEGLLPAVVNISTTQTIKRPEGGDVPMPQFPPGSPFEDLFRDFLEQQGAPRKVTSLGSGFVIDPKGIIVTNNHVIDEADEITVTLADGDTLPADLVGRDPKTDIAVLRVKPKKPLSSVQFGDSDKARVGDWVLAVGNPFGLGGSLSAGIVSARNRNINEGPYDDFIQTDAAINRGNSGGPLFDLSGHVVGVNSAIISPSGGSVGIGFAVPANVVQPVVKQLVQFGETRRGWLGVRIQTVTDDMAEAMSLDKARGALVAGVTENGPAAKAGIQPGDLIVSFDGKPITEMRTLPRIVADTAIGKRVPMEIIRNGERRTVEVRIGRLEDAERTAMAEVKGDHEPATKTETSALGLSLSPLTADLRNRYQIPGAVRGVLVTKVDPAGPAAEKGLAPGDVIVEVAQEPVAQPKDVTMKVAKATAGNKKSVLLLVNRQGELSFVAVRVAQS
jgi:serine protease Do